MNVNDNGNTVECMSDPMDEPQEIDPKKERTRDLEDETIRDCPILYNVTKLPVFNKRCSCSTHWEFGGGGWDEIMSRLSRRLEVINQTYYPKYRVKIVFDQVKSKYGLLTVYHSVVEDPGKFVCFIARIVSAVEQFLSRTDYKTTYVTDEEERVYEKTEPYDYKYYEAPQRENYYKYVLTGSTIDKKYDVHVSAKRHIEPRRMKLMYKVWRYSIVLGNKLMGLGRNSNNSKRNNVASFLNDVATEEIRKAEKEASETCEICGRQIGTKWSPVCQTVGWVSYICEDCAKEGGEYYKGKVKYLKGEKVSGKDGK